MDAGANVGWAPMAADLVTVALLLDDLPYPAHLSAVDADRTYPWVAANKAVLGLLGRERDDIVGRPLADIIPDPDAVATMRKRRDEVAATLVPAKYELAVELPSGRRRFDTTLVPIRNGDGGCGHVFGVWNDATAQRETEARSRAILQATPDIVVTVRRDGTLVSIDGSVLHLLSDTSGIVGSRVSDLYPSEFTDRVLELIRRTLDTGELQCDEFLVSFDGIELLLEGRTVPIGPDLVLGIGRDITERKRADDALRQSEAQLRADVAAREETERDLRRRVEVEQLISDVSRHLGTVTADDMDDTIVQLLARTAMVLGADAARLLRNSDDDQWSVCTHEWLAPPVAARDPQRDERLPLHPLMIAAADRDYVFVRRPEDLAPELSKQREQMEEAGVHSVVRIPMRLSGRLTGFLVFFWFDDGAAEREPLFSALRVLGDVVESALERQRAENAVRESEERFRVLVQNTSDVISVMRADGTLTFVSPAVTSVLGWETEGWEGPFNPFEFIHPDDRDRVATAFAEGVATSRRGQPIEYRMRHADGSWRHMESVGNNLLDDPAVRGVVVNTRDITDRKAADVALRDSEQRFRLLATGAPVGIFQTDAEGKCLFVNSYWCDRAGMRPEDALGDGWADALHPDDRERVFEEWNNTAGTGRIFDLDYRFRTPDGQVSWLTGHGVPLRDETGTITGYLGTILDISERQRAERLRAAHVEAERLVSAISRRVLTASADDIDTVIREALGDLSHFVGACAAAIQRYSGDSGRSERTHAWLADDMGHLGDVQRDEDASASWLVDALAEADLDHIVFDLDDLPEHIASSSLNAIRGAGVHALGFLPVRSGGRLSGFVALTWSEPAAPEIEILLPTLRVLGDVFIAALDRTRTERERIEADEALRRNEERLRALVQNTNDVISVLDGDGRIVYSSPAVAIFGWSEDSLVGTDAFELVHPDDRERVRERFFAGLVDQRDETVEFRLRTADGTWRDVEAIGNNLLDDPAVGGVVLTSRDITERKRAEEKLRQSEQRFRALVQNTSDVISVMRADGTLVFVSPAVTRILGWTNERLDAPFHPLDFVHPDDRDRVAAAYVEGVDGRPVEYRMRHADGSWRYMESIANDLLDDPAVRGVVVTTRDITARKQEEEAQARRAAAEQLVSAISRRVLTASADDIDAVIEEALGEAARFVGGRAAGLLQYSDDGSCSTRTHAWFGDGAEHFERFPAERSAAPWFAEGLRDVDHLVIDVDDLPADGGHDRDGLRAAGIHTLGFLPIRSGGRVSGFVAFSWFEAVPDEVGTLLPTLRVLGDVFVAALDRAQTERERIEADAALRRSEERFRALVQNSSDMITVLDADGLVRYTSPASRTILGLDENEETGGLGFDRVHPDDLDAITRVFTEALSRPGPTESVQVRLRHEDGSWRTIEAVGTNLLHDPAVEGLVVNGRDVTERVRLEEHFRALVQNTSDMITVLDAEGRIVYASPAAEAILGWPIPEWIGRHVFELVHPDDLERISARFIQAVAEEGMTEPVEFRMRRADGTWVHIEGIGNSLFHDPAVNGIVVTARDVTERKRLEAELLQAQKMEAVGQLAGGVAHDFNNLLTAITGYTALLLDATAVGDPRREDLEEIAHAGTRATKLVDQLLSFSRRRTVQPTELDLGEVVESMRSLVDRLLPADIDVVTELSAGLDPIEADRSQVEQILMNLVVNARDAMPEGGRLVIETTTGRLDDDSPAAHVGVVPGEYVVLAVSDDGVGMDAATRARVFEPFFTTKDVGQGTGLGLSTVYGIVTQAGGQVTVYSEPDRGTTFRVYFPSVEASADDRSGPAAPIAEQARGTETVLLVEDEAAVRALASQVLTRLGYSVLEASDGQRALEVAAAHDSRIDLLVTDVVLPRASGIEVAEKLTADFPHLRVLFMSGYTEAAVGPDGELGGDGHFLPKPFQPTDLTRRVREILDGVPRG